MKTKYLKGFQAGMDYVNKAYPDSLANMTENGVCFYVNGKRVARLTLWDAEKDLWKAIDSITF